MHLVVPAGAVIGGQLAVSDHPTVGIGVLVQDGGLHVDGLGQDHAAPAQVEGLEIRLVEQDLKAFLQARDIIAERLRIPVEVVILFQGQPRGIGHREHAFETEPGPSS
jgi:hypothetical protein